jgi:hypothetical protein
MLRAAVLELLLRRGGGQAAEQLLLAPAGQALRAFGEQRVRVRVRARAAAARLTAAVRTHPSPRSLPATHAAGVGFVKAQG